MACLHLRRAVLLSPGQYLLLVCQRRLPEHCQHIHHVCAEIMSAKIENQWVKWWKMSQICPLIFLNILPNLFLGNSQRLDLCKVCSCQSVRNRSISFCKVVSRKSSVTVVVFMLLGFKEVSEIPTVHINVQLTLRCPVIIHRNH